MEGKEGREMPDDKALREDVLLLLQGRKAHVGFEKAVANLPEGLRGKKPRGMSSARPPAWK